MKEHSSFVLSSIDEGRFGRSKWWREARLGMFIHWGIYALHGRDAWVRSHENTSVQDYQKYVDSFVPDTDIAEEWADRAHRAGMKYAVLTAKHHDGFCLFDSKVSTYTSAHSACGRDLVREFLDAFRKRGIKVGLYMSLIDWHHPDFPHFGDMYHPMRSNPAYRDHTPDLDRYNTFLHEQVRELCTNYGKLDVLWFDFSYDPMWGEAWRATDLVTMVRTLQPEVVIDNRLETSGAGFGSIVTDDPKAYAGDFVSAEQVIPAVGIRNDKGEPVPWEACLTMNNSWGYAPGDALWKSPKMLIGKLAECVSKGGNMLLNIGPDPKGRIPSESIDILAAIETWMGRHGEAIHGADAAPYHSPDWGWYTAKDRAIYAHVTQGPIGPLALTGGLRKEHIKKITCLTDGTVVEVSGDWITHAYPDIPFVSLGQFAHATYPPRDPLNTVYRIDLAD